MPVTKERIIDAVFEAAELPRKTAREAVQNLMAIIKQTLAAEEDVLVSGFGKFQVRRKKTRLGRNPQTGKVLELRPRRVVTFRISRKLRLILNGEEVDSATPDDFDSGDKPRTKKGKKADKNRP